VLKTLSGINAKTAHVSTVGKMAPVIDVWGSELTTTTKKQWTTEFSRVTGGKSSLVM